MGLLEGSEYTKQARAKKMMLLFGIISMVMTFGGLTSAYVVSKSRPDWLTELELPVTFTWSTIAIVISSLTFHFAKKSVLAGARERASMLLIVTLALAGLFVFFQIESFGQFIADGYFFTGSESSITTSFIYILVLVHLAHLFAGILVLLVVIYNHFRQKYYPGRMLGFELGVMFWHFVDILWIYLFFFLYFFK